ncbi:hypothetical protein C8R45DRAFT_1032994 [Mycena sanguinolenta]|nr:hypothetical protein C8R45DRAFT_1032994 [Mycena sanguinolenta]
MDADADGEHDGEGGDADMDADADGEGEAEHNNTQDVHAPQSQNQVPPLAPEFVHTHSQTQQHAHSFPPPASSQNQNQSQNTGQPLLAPEHLPAHAHAEPMVHLQAQTQQKQYVFLMEGVDTHTQLGPPQAQYLPGQPTHENGQMQQGDVGNGTEVQGGGGAGGGYYRGDPQVVQHGSGSVNANGVGSYYRLRTPPLPARMLPAPAAQVQQMQAPVQQETC